MQKTGETEHQHKWGGANIITEERKAETFYTFIWKCSCGARQTGLYREVADPEANLGKRSELVSMTVTEASQRPAD